MQKIIITILIMVGLYSCSSQPVVDPKSKEGEDLFAKAMVDHTADFGSCRKYEKSENRNKKIRVDSNITISSDGTVKKFSIRSRHSYKLKTYWNPN